MRSITACGFCVVAALSSQISGLPLTYSCRIGKSRRKICASNWRAPEIGGSASSGTCCDGKMPRSRDLAVPAIGKRACAGRRAQAFVEEIIGFARARRTETRTNDRFFAVGSGFALRPCVTAFLTEWLCKSRDAGRASECQRLEGEDWSRGRACTRRRHRGHSSRRETRNARRCRTERLSPLHRRRRQARSRSAVQQAEIVERWKDRHGAAERAWNKGQVELRLVGRRSAIVEGRPKAAAVTAKPVLPRRALLAGRLSCRSRGRRRRSPRQAARRRGPVTTARLRPAPVRRPRLASSSATPAVRRSAHLAPTRSQAHGRTPAPRAGSRPAPVAHRPARLETANWRSRRSTPDQVPRLARPQPFRTRWSLGTAPPGAARAQPRRSCGCTRDTCRPPRSRARQAHPRSAPQASSRATRDRRRWPCG